MFMTEDNFGSIITAARDLKCVMSTGVLYYSYRVLIWFCVLIENHTACLYILTSCISVVCCSWTLRINQVTVKFGLQLLWLENEITPSLELHWTILYLDIVCECQETSHDNNWKSSLLNQWSFIPCGVCDCEIKKQGFSIPPRHSGLYSFQQFRIFYYSRHGRWSVW